MYASLGYGWCTGDGCRHEHERQQQSAGCSSFSQREMVAVAAEQQRVAVASDCDAATAVDFCCKLLVALAWRLPHDDVALPAQHGIEGAVSNMQVRKCFC